MAKTKQRQTARQLRSNPGTLERMRKKVWAEIRNAMKRKEYKG